MSDFLAIERDNRSLSVIDASVSKGSLRLRKSFTLELPGDEQLVAESGAPTAPTASSAAPQLGEAERTRLLGGWLLRRLRERRVASKPVLICLPREESVVRQIEVPDVPDAELADIVRLQAETRISSSLEKLLLDFVPLPRRADQGQKDALKATVAREDGSRQAPDILPLERTVLMATVTRDAANRLQNVLKVAELEPASIGLSSLAALEIVTRADQKRGFSPDETSLVLSRQHNRLEITLLRQKSMLFTHAAQLSVESEEEAIQSTLAEVSRSFVALQRVLGGAKLSRAWVIGPLNQTQPLCAALKGRLDCTVLPLEPLTELGLKIEDPDPDANNACFAGPLGMLLAAAEQTVEQLDFLNPRKSAQKMDKRKVRAVQIAAAAVLLLLIGGIGNKLYLDAIDRKITLEAAELRDLKEFNLRGKNAIDSAVKFNQWKMVDRNIPEQMRELNQALPGTDRIYLKSLHFTHQGQQQNMRVKADGFAIDRSDVENLNHVLSGMNYAVKPTSIPTTTKDPRYKFVLNLDAGIPQQAAKPAAANKSPAGK